jgi:hypothetical protein
VEYLKPMFSITSNEIWCGRHVRATGFPRSREWRGRLAQ